MKAARLALLLPCMLSVPLPAPSAETAGEAVNLTLPQLNWVLEIGAPGLVIEEKEVADSKEAARFFGTDEKTGVIMSAFLEKADHPGDAKECRAFYWARGRKSPTKKDGISMSESGGMAILEYLVPEEQGITVNHKNLNAYLSRDGYWIDIHLSKMRFTPPEEKLFKDILARVKIRPKSSLSDRPAPRRYGLPGHGSITLDVPESWQDAIRHPPRNLPPTFVFSPPAGNGFSILFTPIWPPAGKAPSNSPEKIRAMQEQLGGKLLAGSVEKELAVKELRGPSAAGCYYSLTDRAPKPGEWTYMTQGAVGVVDLLAGFTILTNAKNSPDEKAALDMFRTMQRHKGSPRAE